MKLHHISRRISIGIVTFTTTETQVSWLFKNGEYYYGIYASTASGHHPWQDMDLKEILGKTVSVYFDTNKLELRYSIHGSGKDIVRAGIETVGDKAVKYRLIVVLAQKDDCVELLNYFEYDHE